MQCQGSAVYSLDFRVQGVVRMQGQYLELYSLDFKLQGIVQQRTAALIPAMLAMFTWFQKDP